jgi:hypothetical protein
VTPDWPVKGDAFEIVSLKPGDEVVGAVELADGEEELVFFTSTADLLRFPADQVRPQGRSGGGIAGIKLAKDAAVIGFSAVPLGGGDTLFDEPVVVTGGGLPPEGRSKGPGVVSSVKVTPLSEYPRKGRATGGVRCQRLLSGEAVLVLGWAGPAPAWAAGAGGEPVDLPTTMGKRDGSGSPVEELVAEGIVKLLARHEGMNADELLATAHRSVAGRGTLTHSSSDGLLEISAVGVSKATGLAELAQERGIGPADVVAFGDMPNDLPMLAWAGRGLAVANAHPEVLSAADEVIGSNDDDGVAAYLEQWF